MGAGRRGYVLRGHKSSGVGREDHVGKEEGQEENSVVLRLSCRGYWKKVVSISRQKWDSGGKKEVSYSEC